MKADTQPRLQQRQRVPSAVAVARRQRTRRMMAVAALLIGALAGILYGADYWVAYRQQQMLAERRAARDRLDRMVLHYLRADVSDVAYTDDGKYRVTFYIENVYPEYDMFVLLPQVTTSVQVGPAWREVPTHDPGNGRLRAGTVIKLNGRITFDRVFELPDTYTYFELLAGFYHVRFDNVMLISPVAEPKEDVAERGDNYYIHLLPIGANLEDIRRRHRFPNGKVPIYLPMPPH